jgi:large subunit ribosomal protein L23
MNVIIKPVITEKSMGQAAKHTYSFIVNKNASKDYIKKVIEREFNVNITNMSTVTIKGKVKRVGQRRVEVTSQPVKKAIVTLKDGQTISMFSLSDEK